MLLMFGLSTGLRYVINKFEIVFEQLKVKSLPRLTEVTFAVGPYFWIAVAAAALEGVRRIRKEDRAGALAWCLGSILAFIAVLSVMAYGLSLPLDQIGKR
jgi:hypothetical protein